MIWYMIKGFNGYEINEQGIVRSMKMMHANPGGLLKQYKDKKGLYYILSNNENKRVKIYVQDLINIVFNSGNKLVARPENSIYLGGRNKRFYFDSGINPESDKQFRMDFSDLIIKDE